MVKVGLIEGLDFTALLAAVVCVSFVCVSSKDQT